MSNIPATKLETQHTPRTSLRAIVEIHGAELAIYPIADSDIEAATILDTLRFVVEDGPDRA